MDTIDFITKGIKDKNDLVRSTFARSFKYSGDREGESLQMFDISTLIEMIADSSLYVK